MLIGLALTARAQPPRHLRFDTLGLEQGLPQETVLAILQDREGFIWLGTQAGLGRFDGYRLTTFTSHPDDPHSLTDNWVDALYEDERGRLWAGSRSGLQVYEPATHGFTRYPLPAGQSRGAASADVRAITGDGHGGLWLATGDGLQHFDPDSGQFRILHDDAAQGGSTLADDVWALERDRAGNLWVGSSAGLDRLAPGAAAFEHFHAVDPAAGAGADPRRNAVHALRADAAGHLWVGTLGGLNRWTFADGDLRREHLDADGLGNEQVNTLLLDHDGNLWVGTETRGLLRWDPMRGHFVLHHHERDDTHSLGDNRVISLFQDRGGTLWIGTWYGGASRVDLDSGGFERFVQEEGAANGLSDNRIRGIFGDGTGLLWLGTSNGLNRLDPVSGEITSLRHIEGDPHSLSDNRVQAVFVDREGQVWAGTAAGLNRYDGHSGRFDRWHFNGGPGDDTIYSIIASRQGVLWIGTDDGLHRFDPATGAVQTFHHDPTQPDSISPGRVPALLEDHAGTLWVGAFGGLDRFDPATGRFTHFRHDVNDPTSISHDRMGCLFEDRDRVLWACTAQGFNRVEPQADGTVRFRNYTVRDGLVADPVGAIQQDLAGRLWISTTGGLSCFDPVTGSFNNYTARDGLIDGSYFVNSSYHAADGTLYFGGIGGLTAFRPEAIRDNPHAPPVVITDVLLFNRSIAAGKLPEGVELDRPVESAHRLVLPYRESAFSVEFAALHFAAPALNQYAYRLDGFDRDWIATGSNKRFASYTNLDPGHYQLHVKAANKDGAWNEAGVALDILILPPFWMTLWFRLLVLLVLLGAAYAAYQWRVRSLQQRQVLLTREVAARTAEVVQQKERVERAHRDISLLSEIGRQITASLRPDDIITTLYQHVNQLMDAGVFGVGVHREDKGVIEFDFAMENGARIPPYVRRMDEPNQLAVWCVVNRREIFVNDLRREFAPYAASFERADQMFQRAQEDGQVMPVRLSMIYVPLMIKGRVLGCIAVQSGVPNAYQPVHLDMLRTLAAYTAVAFDNADAYAQLQRAQQQLVQQKMMASLGRLVAGIAHEANTPIGNIRTVASLLHEQVDGLAARYGEKGMPRAEVGEFLEFLREATAVIERGTVRAIDLISRFKQLAIEPGESSAQQPFDANGVLELALRTRLPQLEGRGIRLQLENEPGIRLRGEAERFVQVIENLIENALLHAFEGRAQGRINVRFRRRDAELAVLEVEDDGNGMDAALLERIFEPYFTTKFGQGGSGLGLYMVHNIVCQLFRGRIRVTSVRGQGTTFTLEFPADAGGALGAVA